MIRPTPKPRNMCDSKKKRWINNGKRKIPLFAINCGTIKVLK
jgi:hypothetical protein